MTRLTTASYFLLLVAFCVQPILLSAAPKLGNMQSHAEIHEGNAKLVLVNMPLASIFKELEMRFDLTIQSSGQIDLAHRMTLYYQSPRSAGAVLSDICFAIKCTVAQAPTGIVVFS